MEKKTSDKKSKSRKGRLRTESLILFCLVLTVVALVWSLYPLKARLEQKEKIDKLSGELSSLKQENKSLKEDVDKLNKDDYLEYLARKDLGLVKPGEEGYLVISQKQEDVEEIQVKEPEKKENKEEDLWQKVEDFFSELAH